MWKTCHVGLFLPLKTESHTHVFAGRVCGNKLFCSAVFARLSSLEIVLLVDIRTNSAVTDLTGSMSVSHLLLMWCARVFVCLSVFHAFVPLQQADTVLSWRHLLIDIRTLWPSARHTASGVHQEPQRKCKKTPFQ